MSLIKGRAKVDAVLVRAQELCAELTVRMTEEEATAAIRSISVQVILSVGSRSFSHFLNAIERYLSLLKFFSKDTEAKAHLLDTAANFWRRNSQMIAIVFDKFMQYQMVDPADVVAWAFRSSETNGDHRVSGSVGVKGWELLKAALDKASGRVVIAKNKVQKVKKEEEDAKAKLKASKGADVDEGMEMDITLQEGEPSSDAPGYPSDTHIHLRFRHHRIASSFRGSQSPFNPNKGSEDRACSGFGWIRHLPGIHPSGWGCHHRGCLEVAG